MNKKLVAPFDLADRVIRFAERYCIVPDGVLVGQKIKLAPFQRKWIRETLRTDRNGVRIPHTSILSIARKNAKSTLIAIIALAALIGPLAETNAQVVVGANSRDQASIIYTQLEKMVIQSEELANLISLAPSRKEARGLALNTELTVVAAEATTAFGKSPKLLIIDEIGQVVGPSSPFIDALTTATGAHEESLTIYISTQAASDGDLFSLLIDDAIRSKDEGIVCHVYCADKETVDKKPVDVLDEEQWAKANPALGIFRSEKELRSAATKASRLTSFESTFRNLYLNQRVAVNGLFIAPSIWRQNNAPVIREAFEQVPVHLALDLSQRNDLTAAVAAADFDGHIHLYPFIFTPENGIEERAKRDRAPYMQWVRDGVLIAVPGSVVDYRWVAEYLREQTESWALASIQFDRWRIDLFKKEATDVGFAVDALWNPVGQGYRDMSPRLEEFEQQLLAHRIAHSSHPLLNMAVSGAIAIADPAKNRKLEKARSTARIDPLVAAVMATYATIRRDSAEEEHPPVSDNAFLFIGKST